METHPRLEKGMFPGNAPITDLEISQDPERGVVYDFRFNGSKVHVEGEQAKKLEVLNSKESENFKN
jgi:hypothetical protein